MTDVIQNPDKKLASGAKNYLDDLLALNAKTTEEMLRGIRESYLDADGAVELAQKLGVEEPKVRRTFYVYYTATEAMSIQVSAYSQEQALAEAQRLHEFNVAYGETHYGSRSRFNDERNGPRRVYSGVSVERPTSQQYTEVVPNPHPWEQERQARFDADAHVSESTVRNELMGRLRNETTIEEDRTTRNRRF